MSGSRKRYKHRGGMSSGQRRGAEREHAHYCLSPAGSRRGGRRGCSSLADWEWQFQAPWGLLRVFRCNEHEGDTRYAGPGGVIKDAAEFPLLGKEPIRKVRRK